MLMKQLSKMFKRQCKPLLDAIRYPANNNSNCANNNSDERSDSEMSFYINHYTTICYFKKYYLLTDRPETVALPIQNIQKVFLERQIKAIVSIPEKITSKSYKIIILKLISLVLRLCSRKRLQPQIFLILRT